MKIAFLNSSMEPGRDGVGDYTRRLAEECVRQGQHCCCIALNDRWITTPESSEQNGVKLLRLPAVMSWKERVRLARELLDEFKPDWVSLQFVPYGFHPKGIVFGLAEKLSPLFTAAKRHIMFHELWIGEYVGASLKDRLVGEVQKQCLMHLYRHLRPEIVHTSNPTYIARLRATSVHAIHLPLFGNVPVLNRKADDWLFPLILQMGQEISAVNRQKYWLFGFFGGLYSNWPPEPLFSRINEVSARMQRKVIILSIGRLGTTERLWNQMVNKYTADFTFVKLGEKSEEMISQYLCSLDFGLATTPYCAVGKSGTVTAMLEHGLPTIVNREEKQWIMEVDEAYNISPLIIRMKDGLENQISESISHHVKQSKLPETANQFIIDLSKNIRSIQ